MTPGGSHWLSELERRRAGAYYTPPELVADLIATALLPVIEDRLGNADDPGAALLGIRVVDPACGDGAFLEPALDALACRVAATGESIANARREVLRHCICGVDSDPCAVEACQSRLADFAGIRSEEVTGIELGDSLLDPPPALKCGASFDCVLGNPPFLNAIERAGRNQRRVDLAALTPELGGTADEAFHFLALAMRLAKQDGRIGMVMPRTLLNAPSAVALRNPGRSRWFPRSIRTLDRPDHFAGRQVFVCLVTLGPTGPCAVASGERFNAGEMQDTNWWRGLHSILNGRSHEIASGPSVSDAFDVRAGMTASEAYLVRPHVADRRAGTELRLVTTGLIDPGGCSWGVRRCRYLGDDYQCPRVIPHAGMHAAFLRRLSQARRPKVIVAGLSSRVECFLDSEGDYAGAVSTFAIFHRKNDVSALRTLTAALLTPEATEFYRDELGANALGGGSIRMTKAFLEAFRWESGKQAAA